MDTGSSTESTSVADIVSTSSREVRLPRWVDESFPDEQRIALARTWRMPSGASLRTSYEFADRTGDTCNCDPYHEFYSVSLPGFVTPPGGVNAHTVDAMRKYDLQDRRQDKLRAIMVQPIGNAATIAATLYGNYNDYDAALGRRGSWTTGGTVQWDYQPGPKTTAKTVTTRASRSTAPSAATRSISATASSARRATSATTMLRSAPWPALSNPFPMRSATAFPATTTACMRSTSASPQR